MKASPDGNGGRGSRNESQDTDVIELSVSKSRNIRKQARSGGGIQCNELTLRSIEFEHSSGEVR